MDQDVTTDDFVGSSIVKVQSLVMNGGVNEWFPIMYKNKIAG